MAEADISKYEYLWTAQRREICLFTVRSYGKEEYLIYHIPSKTIRLVADCDVGKCLVRKLLECGVPLFRDHPHGEEQKAPVKEFVQKIV